MLELNGANTLMKGRWLGFGGNPGEINDGAWQLTLVGGGVDRATRERWDVPPGEASTADDDSAP